MSNCQINRKGAKVLEASMYDYSKDQLIMEVKRAKAGDKEAFCALISLRSWEPGL